MCRAIARSGVPSLTSRAAYSDMTATTSRREGSRVPNNLASRRARR